MQICKAIAPIGQVSKSGFFPQVLILAIFYLQQAGAHDGAQTGIGGGGGGGMYTGGGGAQHG